MSLVIVQSVSGGNVDEKVWLKKSMMRSVSNEAQGEASLPTNKVKSGISCWGTTFLWLIAFGILWLCSRRWTARP